MRARLVPFYLIVLTSFYVLFTPASEAPILPEGFDKLGHFALFGAGALTGRMGRLPERPLIVGLIGYAVLSECLQGILPLGRSASGWDVVADLVGIAIGIRLARRAGR